MQTHLDGLGCLQRLFRWDSHLPLPQELLGEVGDVSPRDGDVFYTASNNIAFSLRGTEERKHLSSGKTKTQFSSLMFSHEMR